jgi:hypothetical protein
MKHSVETRDLMMMMMMMMITITTTLDDGKISQSATHGTNCYSKRDQSPEKSGSFPEGRERVWQ